MPKFRRDVGKCNENEKLKTGTAAGSSKFNPDGLRGLFALSFLLKDDDDDDDDGDDDDEEEEDVVYDE